MVNEKQTHEQKGDRANYVRKFDEARPGVPLPRPRKFLRSFTIGFRLEKSDIPKIDERAKAFNLTRSSYLRKLVLNPTTIFITAKEQTEVAKRLEMLETDAYSYIRGLIRRDCGLSE